MLLYVVIIFVIFHCSLTYSIGGVTSCHNSYSIVASDETEHGLIVNKHLLTRYYNYGEYQVTPVTIQNENQLEIIQMRQQFIIRTGKMCYT